jgi:hypothetical protein
LAASLRDKNKERSEKKQNLVIFMFTAIFSFQKRAKKLISLISNIDLAVTN